MAAMRNGRELRAIRDDHLRMTQTQVAQALGVSLRTYQLIEGDLRPPSRSYQLAVHMLSLRQAAERRDARIATPEAREVATAFGLLDEVRTALDEMMGRRDG